MIIKGTRFIKADIDAAKKFFGAEDVYTSKDKKILKIFALVLQKQDIFKAINYANDNGHTLFIIEAEDRKGMELCFRHMKEYEAKKKEKEKRTAEKEAKKAERMALRDIKRKERQKEYYKKNRERCLARQHEYNARKKAESAGIKA